MGAILREPPDFLLFADLGLCGTHGGVIAVVREDNIHEDKLREDNIREDNIREDNIREDKLREDKLREDKVHH